MKIYDKDSIPNNNKYHKHKVTTTSTLETIIICIIKMVIAISSTLTVWIIISTFLDSETLLEKALLAPFIIAILGIIIASIAPTIINHFRGKNIMVNRSEQPSIQEGVRENKVKKIENIGAIIAMCAFLIFWFAIVFLGQTYAINTWNEDGKILFFGLFIFWIPGLYLLYLIIELIKKNKSK